MKQIRKAVFETNSSSTHSISIEGSASGSYNFNPIEGYFLRPEDNELLSSPEKKMAYILTAVAHEVLLVYEVNWWKTEDKLLNFYYLVDALEHSLPFVWIKELVLEKTEYPLRVNWGSEKKDFVVRLFGNIFSEEDNEILVAIKQTIHNRELFKELVTNIVFNDGIKISCDYSPW